MIFIFGYGYTANFFCEKIIDQKIFATSRSIDNKVQAHKNISIISPLETEYILEKYTDEISHILISVPPDNGGDIFLKNVSFDLTRLTSKAEEYRVSHDHPSKGTFSKNDSNNFVFVFLLISFIIVRLYY